ncbi:DegV family protein [Bombilactobacillus folatiphilus]|uniref:DegV family protein n=1 Tax=Bombilactobacillus folatiphilus TaxID=2923362 RepID=A0ABY4PAK9_9LACO|nr:DegV family protein [Bombilactobacillus folatiphilus]UQS82783.1 DegV family protein [Bombilactobacillus folatiphilus]
MANVKILTDSSVQLTSAEIDQYQITVVPLTVAIDGKQYIDGHDITRQEFADEMLSSTNFPKTSQPPIGRFLDAFNQLGEDGSEILAITLTKGLSGTVDAARQAAELSDAKVTVIDSGSTDRGMAFQVIEAAKMAQKGAQMSELVAKVQEIVNNMELYVCIPHPENIIKGGRLGKVAASLTSLLNIDVVVQVKNNKLSIARKGRGVKVIKRFVAETLSRIETDSDRISEVGMSYVSDKTFPEQIAQELQQKCPNVKPFIELTSPIIMTHTGEGAFAIIFYRQ